MNKKLLLALTSGLITMCGAFSLTQPAGASEPFAAAMFGCSIDEYSAEIAYAHHSCRSMGYDGGTVTYCDGQYMSYECWNV